MSYAAYVEATISDAQGWSINRYGVPHEAIAAGRSWLWQQRG
jgi:hypothetical protein